MPNIMDYFRETEDAGDLSYLVKSPANKLTLDELIAIRAGLEEIAESGLEITITFHPMIHNRYKSITLTRMVFDLLTSLRIKPCSTLEIIMVGEFSKTGMYHMHGVIYSNDARQLNNIKRRLNKEIGRTEIKMIRNTVKYIDYILKDTPIREVLQDEVIRFIHRYISVNPRPKDYNTQ